MVTPSPSPAAAPLDLVIFGGVGDLSVRKLLPALYMAHLHNNLPEETRIHALGRQSWDRAAFLHFIHEKVRGFIGEKAYTDEAWASFVRRLCYVCIDATEPASFLGLKAEMQPGSDRVYYLATAPSLFVGICANLSGAGLIDERSRVVLEKPLGHDLASAQQINNDVGQYFEEHQVFRIDHYLGKETVQNLMVLRFGNSIFEPLWRSPQIKSIQITVAESVGVGSRAGFYDGTGAMRDMMQNHLLQLLCIVAMEPPSHFADPDAVRRRKAQGLALAASHDGDRRSAATQRALANTARAPRAVKRPKGYLQEERPRRQPAPKPLSPSSAHINNWRWANVPIFLRTGKRMAAPQSEIVIEFARPALHHLQRLGPQVGQPPADPPAAGGTHPAADDGQGTRTAA